MGAPYIHCPKCGHAPLPVDQALPACCPACGVVLAKIGQQPQRRNRVAQDPLSSEEVPAWIDVLAHVPERVDATWFWLRVATLAAFAVWGFVLIRLDYRVGEMAESFLHRPLLVFHEAGHVLAMPFGEWMTIFGGTLGQLLMPLLLAGALLLKNRDPFGACIGLWFLGVSVLDVAPYLYDALHPRLMLLSGTTGEEGGHDWIYLLGSMGQLAKAQTLGALVHKAGALLVVLSLAWGGWILRRQHKRMAAQVARGQ